MPYAALLFSKSLQISILYNRPYTDEAVVQHCTNAMVKNALHTAGRLYTPAMQAMNSLDPSPALPSKFAAKAAGYT